MEHLITFNEKKIALSRTDIAGLYPALEPYFLAIMQGLNEIETTRFVSEYKQFVKSLAESRRKQLPTPNTEKSTVKENITIKPTQNATVIDINSKKR